MSSMESSIDAVVDTECHNHVQNEGSEDIPNITTSEIDSAPPQMKNNSSTNKACGLCPTSSYQTIHRRLLWHNL